MDHWTAFSAMHSVLFFHSTVCKHCMLIDDVWITSLQCHHCRRGRLAVSSLQAWAPCSEVCKERLGVMGLGLVASNSQFSLHHNCTWWCAAQMYIFYVCVSACI